MLFLSVHRAYGSELQIYPKDKHHTLQSYEIGVEHKVKTNSHVAFVFKNTLEGKTATTEGEFRVAPKYKVKAIIVTLVLINLDKRVVNKVPLIAARDGGNIYKFSIPYPYTPDYEYCVFNVKLLVELTKRENAIDGFEPKVIQKINRMYLSKV